MGRSRSHVALVLASAFCAALPAVPAAASIDLDDPNLFGPGEGWPTPAEMQAGDSGPWTIRLQEALTDAGFRPGDSDGVFGKSTLGAVYAFEKIHGLERDGVFGEDDWALLDAEIDLPATDASPDRVEIDLERQVLLLVKDSNVEVVLPISSGNGDYYRGRGGAQVRARTPEGSYSFYRHIRGWRISYLGGLYNPYYFRGGYAIHGSSSVPPYPASHGCVRVEIHDMDYLVDELSVGMPIYVYGNNVTRETLLPPIETPAIPSPENAPRAPVDDPIASLPIVS